MSRHRQHFLAAAVITLAALLTVSVPAHAVSANVPLPQTPVELPSTEVTVTEPGAGVNVGPGGINLNVDPQKAIGDGTGSPPSAGSPASGTAGSSPPQGSVGGVGTAPAPRGGSGGGSGGGSQGGSRNARPAPSTGAASGSADRETPSSSEAPARAGIRSVAASPVAARKDPSEPGIVSRIFERISTELLLALLVTALIAAAMSLVWVRERGRVRAARRQAQVDPLTGIANRLAFEDRVAHEWKRARRYDRPLGLLLLDLDGLKRVNDNDGHEAGDRMIKAAADQISAHIRQSDLAARLAGDEFVVLCPETHRVGLEQIGTKLRECLAHGGVAASVGWAELADGDLAPGDLMARADAAMYQEKARRCGTRPVPTARPNLAIAG